MASRKIIKNRFWNLTEGPEYDGVIRNRHRLELRDRILLNKASGNVLEIGCGMGRFLGKLRYIEKVTSVLGVDNKMYVVDVARNEGFIAILANAERLPFKKDTFDTILSANASVARMQWELLLPEISRVLKKGGFFAFDTFNKYPFEKKIKYKFMRILNVKHKPFEGILGGIEDIDEFSDMCRGFGFNIVSLFTLLPLPFRPYGLLLKGSFFCQCSARLIGVLRRDYN